MNRHNELEGPPCKRMEAMLQEVADGKATGWRRWYALAHAARCYRCGTFLTRMQVTVHALRNAKTVVSAEDTDPVARLRARAKEISNKP